MSSFFCNSKRLNQKKLVFSQFLKKKGDTKRSKIQGHKDTIQTIKSKIQDRVTEDC